MTTSARATVKRNGHIPTAVAAKMATKAKPVKAEAPKAEAPKVKPVKVKPVKPVKAKPTAKSYPSEQGVLCKVTTETFWTPTRGKWSSKTCNRIIKETWTVRDKVYDTLEEALSNIE